MLRIEHVGTLVSPAKFDVVVNKTDLLPCLDLDVGLFGQDLRMVNPTTRVIYVSAKSGGGLEAWCERLEGVKVEAQVSGRFTARLTLPRAAAPPRRRNA